MVFTIHRYIFRDLFKVFALSTVAMTLILSLGSILRPIQKYGVAPEQVFSLIGYFMPITLTFVMPMAALFAAAMTYGRFASDNELDACRASGISTMTIVYPGLCLAVTVAILNIFLSFYVVPKYVDKAERSIKANAKQIVFRSIERQGYYEGGRGRFVLMADAALIDQDRLVGVNIIETKKGKPKGLITTETADVEFDTHTSYNNVTIVAREAYQLDQQGQAYTKELPIKAKLPSLLADDIKFQEIEELKKIKSNPLNFSPVRDLSYQAFSQLTTELLAQEISRTIANQENRFYQMQNDQRIILFTADGCKVDKGEIILSGKVELYEYDSHMQDELIRKWESQGGKITVEDDEPFSQMVLILENASWTDSDGLSGVPTTHNVRDLSYPEDLAKNLQSRGVLNTLDNASSFVNSPSESLKNLITRTNREIVATFGEIEAEIHSRLVFGIGCIVLILMAIALGIIYKGGHLLTAFGISSIPAAFLIVFMMMGKNLTKNIVKNTGQMSMNGIFIMWLGLIILTVLAIWIYRKLLRT